jgi:hypothetical protein
MKATFMSTGFRFPAFMSEVHSSTSCAWSACLAAAAASSVPMKAKATPTELITRYFHIASSDSFERCWQMRNAVRSVTASMPTHIRPRLLDTSVRPMAAREPHQRLANCLAWPLVRASCSISRP